jgi:hypothetical protein
MECKGNCREKGGISVFNVQKCAGVGIKEIIVTTCTVQQ